jgi:hypothetical protein
MRSTCRSQTCRDQGRPTPLGTSCASWDRELGVLAPRESGRRADQDEGRPAPLGTSLGSWDRELGVLVPQESGRRADRVRVQTRHALGRWERAWAAGIAS